jgi:hypothetical protein
MQLDANILDKLYKQYGYKVVAKADSVKLYLYEQGRYYGADIIPLDESDTTIEECNKIKSEYANGGYAVQIKKYSDNENAALELYRSFFSYDTTKKRINNKYQEFTKLQSKINGGYKYEYINSPFQINNEASATNDIINQISLVLKRKRPQLVIIEASAGYGKTCTAFEVLKTLLSCDFCENPLMTVLSRNRGANIFRYILLDEIDREYPTLDSNLVTFEIKTGRIPLIIDGFDELLSKSDIVKSEKDKVFGEVETMLDTIGNLLKGNAKIILTSRRTAIFAGQEFQNWLKKWNDEFDSTRFSIEIPRIKDWLTLDRLTAIRDSQIPVENIANPVLLTYLRNLEETIFIKHLLEPNSIIKKYFYSLHQREMIRQDLKISPEDQYSIFKNVVRMMIHFNETSDERSFFRDIIIDQNKEILDKAIKLYPADKTIEWLADKLINHALLDRKGRDEDMIGFINDFVFGTFIGEIMSEATYGEIEKSFSPYMVEIGATAYRVQSTENKILLWNKIEAFKEKFENSILFSFDITLKGQIERSFELAIFQSIQIFKIQFTNKFIISSSVFINCKFKNCIFNSGAFESVSFIECLFEDCKTEDIEHINEYINTYTIKCTQKGSDVLTYDTNSSEGNDKADLVKKENEFLKEFYQFEIEFKSQRLMQFMKRHDKSEHKFIASIINKLEKEKIIRISGLDMFIEVNKLKLVKQRIGIK